MKYDKLINYLGKDVKVTLFDGYTCSGELHKTGEKRFENDPNLSIPLNYYFLTAKECNFTCSCLFKSSHIRSIKEI